MCQVLPAPGIGVEVMKKDSVIKKVATSLRVKDGMCSKGHSLMSAEKLFGGERAIVVRVRHGGHEGTVYLNPFFGRFEIDCSIPVTKGDVLDIFCPECGESLSVDTMCRLCNIPMFAVQLPDGGQVEACPKIGCHNHSLTIVDLDAQLKRMYVEDETKVQM